jgi:hypothetical protein
MMLIFESKMGEMVGNWRRLHIEWLRNFFLTLYFLDDEVLEDKMGEAYSSRGKDEKYIQYFGWKT